MDIVAKISQHQKPLTGREVGIALLSEAAALWFDAEVIIPGPLNPLLAAEIPFGCLLGNPVEGERDSAVKPNTIPL